MWSDLLRVGALFVGAVSIVCTALLTLLGLGMMLVPVRGGDEVVGALIAIGGAIACGLPGIILLAYGVWSLAARDQPEERTTSTRGSSM